MTASRLNRWGHDIPITCDACGARDTVFHRVWSDCPTACAIRDDLGLDNADLLSVARRDPDNPLFSKGWVVAPDLSTSPAVDPPIRFETYDLGGRVANTDPFVFFCGGRGSVPR